jgi:hypothetical protein
MSLGGGGFTGTVDGLVPVGVVLPGTHGFATVADVPLGRDGLAEATVELDALAVPLLVDAPPVVEVPLLGVVVVVVPALVLLAGVHGATVVLVPA